MIYDTTITMTYCFELLIDELEKCENKEEK